MNLEDKDLNHLKTKGNSEVVGVEFETKDYHRFSFYLGNRALKKNHIETCKKKLSTKYLNVPITVKSLPDGKLGIVEGQHRFKACQELGLPVKYVLETQKITLKDIQMLNSNSSTWRLHDFFEANIHLQKPDYQYLQEFQTKYKLELKICIVLLSGANYLTGHFTKYYQDFLDGEWHISPENKETAQIRASRIKEISSYLSHLSFKSFLQRACLIVVSNPNYKHEIMMQKIKYQTDKILMHRSISFIVQDLIRVYNHKTREADRLVFTK